jgi:hypothetical protein
MMANQNFKKDIEIIKGKFSKFKGYITVSDFKTFLLMTFTEDTEENMMKMMMEGGNPNRNIYWDKEKNALVMELLPPEKNLMTILKNPPDLNKQIIKLDDREFFDQYLSKFEQENLMDKKGEIRIVEYTNFIPDLLEKHNIHPIFEISKVYNDLLSMLFGIGKVKSIFILDGEGDEPDILFSFYVSLTTLVGEKFIPVHAYADYSKICRDSQFIKYNKESHEYEGVKELMEVSHSELFKNVYILLVHVKSFESI